MPEGFFSYTSLNLPITSGSTIDVEYFMLIIQNKLSNNIASIFLRYYLFANNYVRLLVHKVPVKANNR